MEAPSGRERRVVGALVRAVFLGDRQGGPWPVPEGLRHQELRLRGNSGADLLARWFPAPRPRGAVVLVHPDRRYGQHWFLREGWVPWLLRARFDVLTFDFPGYGGSRGGSTYFHEDVQAAVEAVQVRSREPVHAVGLSLGAFAAINAAPRLDLGALVLEAPYPSFNAWYRRGPPRWAMAAFDAVFPRTSALIQADRNIARAGAERLLVAAAGADDITPAALTRAVADAAPAERTQYLELAGLHHLTLFRQSTRYREAVLEALGVPEDEAFALARPEDAPSPRLRGPLAPPR